MESLFPDEESDDSEMDFSKPWDLSDVSFLVEEKRLYANKGLMSIWSPVIKAMFYHDFKEKGSAEVELPGKKFEDIDELMKVLHPPNKPVDDNNVGILLSLAREYQMKNITKKCEQFLLSKSPSLVSLVLADEYALTGLQKVCMDYTKTCFFSQLKNDSGFKDLCKDTKIKILLNLSEKQSPILEKILSRVTSVSCFDCTNQRYRPHSVGERSDCNDCALWRICGDLKPLRQ